MQKKFGSITSSQDPEQIAQTVKGIVLGLSSVIILVATQFFHVTLSANDVLSLATEAGTIAGVILTLYGLVMKLLAWKFRQV